MRLVDTLLKHRQRAVFERIAVSQCVSLNTSPRSSPYVFLNSSASWSGSDDMLRSPNIARPCVNRAGLVVGWMGLPHKGKKPVAGLPNKSTLSTLSTRTIQNFGNPTTASQASTPALPPRVAACSTSRGPVTPSWYAGLTGSGETMKTFAIRSASSCVAASSSER